MNNVFETFFLKVPLTNNVLETFLDLFWLDLSLILRGYSFLSLCDKLGHLVCRKLHVLSFSMWSFLDEPFNEHVNHCKMSIFGLDYVYRNLKTGRNGLESKDDVCSSEFFVTVEKDLKSQNSIELRKVH